MYKILLIALLAAATVVLLTSGVPLLLGVAMLAAGFGTGVGAATLYTNHRDRADDRAYERTRNR